MQKMETADVLCYGNGSHKIVAIHGIQGTRASWLPLVETLQEETHWILPNLRGRGDAPRGNGSADYTLEKFAADIADVIAQHAGASPYVLAGWSMGVSVALATIVELQRRKQPLPQAMILMSGSPVLKQTHWFRATGHAALLKRIAEREVRLGLRNAADRDAVAWTWQAIGNTDQRPLLSAIDIPTLIVHGSADEDSPWPHAQLLARGLPHASLRTIDGGMHSILTQDTARVAQEIHTFLSTSFQPSSSGSIHEKQ